MMCRSKVHRASQPTAVTDQTDASAPRQKVPRGVFAEGTSGRVRHLPGGAARAGNTSGRVLVQRNPPLAAQNGRGGGREDLLNSFNGPHARIIADCGRQLLAV
jgi:hypothetical protein